MRFHLEFLEKWIVGVTLFAGFFYFVALAVDPDLGWHLRSGEWLAAHRAIPTVDQYSFTMPGFAWVNHEWLLDFVFWWMRTHQAWWVLVLFFTVLASIPFFVWIRRARSFLELWPGIILPALLFIGYIGVRPQVLSFFLFFLELEILTRHYEPNATHRDFVWLALPLIFFIWANLYAGFAAGLLLFGVYFAVNVAITWWKSKRFLAVDLAWRLPVLLASTGATFLTPHGWKLHQEIWTVLRSQETARYIAEWQLGLATASWIVPALVAMFAFLVWQFRKDYAPQLLISALLFLAGFMRSAKMGPLFIITAMPLINIGLRRVSQEIAQAHYHHPFPRPLIRVWSVLKITIPSLLLVLLTSAVFLYQPFQLPRKAVETLRQYIGDNKTVILFNEYGWGGFLVWNLPELKVFSDGRMPHWVDSKNHSAMKEYIQVRYQDSNAWKEIFKKYGINTALVQRNRKESRSAFGSKLSNYIPERTLGWVRQSRWARWLQQRLLKERGVDLTTELTTNGWRVLHEDDLAFLLTCPQEPCW